MKILSVGTELFHRDRLTDVTKVIVACAIVRTGLKTHDEACSIFSQILRKSQKITIRNRRREVEGRGQERKGRKEMQENRK
jgi:hypothetical protein